MLARFNASLHSYILPGVHCVGGTGCFCPVAISASFVWFLLFNHSKSAVPKPMTATTTPTTVPAVAPGDKPDVEPPDDPAEAPPAEELEETPLGPADAEEEASTSWTGLESH